MVFNINELRETLELNRNEIMHNHLLTNEYMIEDIMVGLGYNKRRNKDVKRLLDKPIDWEVASEDNPRLAVKVFALGDEVDNIKLQEAMDYSKEKSFSIFIVTNGEKIIIYRYNEDEKEYTKLCDIHLEEELSDTNQSILEAISNDGFNLEVIDSLIQQSSISNEKVLEVIENNLDILASNVATWIGDTRDSQIEQCREIISSLIFRESSDEVVATNEDKERLDTEVEKRTLLENELENTKTELENTKTELENTKTELENTKTELENTKTELENLNKNIEDTSNDDSEQTDLIEYTDKIEALQNKIKEKECEIEQLKNTIDSNKSSNDTGDNKDTNIQSEIDAYREKIQELSNKAAESEDLVKKLTKELKEAKESLENMSGVDKQKAIDLLGVIEDSKELPRSYVAVINTELIQYDDLPTFVGRSLQKLYEIKNYEASQFIFNGDIFKLVQPAERNDLIMNNKAYDVKVDGIHEDEVLNKLRIVYSHFSNDVIFECKKIGSLDITESTSVTYNDFNAEDNFSSDIENNEDGDLEYGKSEDELDAIQIDNSDELDIDLEEQISDTQEDESTENLLCSQLLQIDELLWTEEDIQFNTIKYIGSSSINFNINMNKEEVGNEQLFCKSLDAVLALAVSMGNTNILSVLRQTDLSQVNNFIKLYTEEYSKYPRINGTKYVVAGIDSVVQVASILADTCNALGIDTSDIFLFFDVNTTSQQLVDAWGYEESAIQLREYTDLQIDDNSNAIAVLKGGIFSNIIVTKNSLQAHKAILKETLAVRTNYLAKIINSDNDFVETIGAIIGEASKSGNNININSIGNVIGEQYKLVSENPSETSSNSIQIDVSGRIWYVSVVENWQMPLSIIKAHTALLSNTSIAVKLNINIQALNFYLTEFEVAEPSLSLAVSSFCRYVQSCIK